MKRNLIAVLVSLAALTGLAALSGLAACTEPTNSSTSPTDTQAGNDTTEVAGKVLYLRGGPVVPPRYGRLHPGPGDRGRNAVREYGELRPVLPAPGGAADRRGGTGPPAFRDDLREGLALYDDKIIQLTWKSGVGFIYDRERFELLRSVAYPGEGWGITYDGARFIMTDGSSNLYFRDKVTFAETGRVVVRDGDGPVLNLNELEYVKGEVYANIWQEDRIARIDPETGAGHGVDRSGGIARIGRSALGLEEGSVRWTCSTASPTMPRGTGCSSPGSGGPGSSRSGWSKNRTPPGNRLPGRSCPVRTIGSQPSLS